MPKPSLRDLLDREASRVAKELGDQTPVPVRQSLVQIRAHHHKLAKALASGMKPFEAQAACGFSASRVSILQADPMFRELVDYYRQNAELEFLGLAAKKAEVAEMAVDLLKERLEDDPDGFSSKDLVQLVETLSPEGASRPASGSSPAFSITFVSPPQASQPVVNSSCEDLAS